LIKLRPTYFPAIFWLIIATVLLLLPSSKLPGEDWMGKLWIDKWIHVGIFSFMVIFWCWPMQLKQIERKKLKMLFFYIGAWWLFYGVMIEFIQKYFIPGRSFDFGDILADAAGCTIGVFYSTGRFIKKIDPCGNRGRNQN